MKKPKKAKTKTSTKKKTAKAKAVKKGPGLPAVPKTPVWAIDPEEQIVGAVLLGKVKGYSSQTGTMSLMLEAPLAAGETIRVKGHTTDLTQRVEQMTVGEGTVQSASPGDSADIAVADRVRLGDAVYKL